MDFNIRPTADATNDKDCVTPDRQTCSSSGAIVYFPVPNLIGTARTLTGHLFTSTLQP
ncbi:MAG: hypothetical protein WCL57_15825 [Chloroflexota bacterium]|jgi:hypothetical protein|nr:hypothetical protein [Chloroflexota bacterium]